MVLGWWKKIVNCNSHADGFITEMSWFLQVQNCDSRKPSKSSDTTCSHFQGIERTKSLLREIAWFPEMDSKVKDVISSCLPSQTVAQPNRPEPLQITNTPEKPWSELAMDYYGPIPQTGQYLMVLIDKYSKYLEVEIVNSTDAKSCIPKLDKIFATHGIPDKMTSDNGPPFNGNDFPVT